MSTQGRRAASGPRFLVQHVLSHAGVARQGLLRVLAPAALQPKPVLDCREPAARSGPWGLAAPAAAGGGSLSQLAGTFRVQPGTPARWCKAHPRWQDLRAIFASFKVRQLAQRARTPNLQRATPQRATTAPRSSETILAVKLRTSTAQAACDPAAVQVNQSKAGLHLRWTRLLKSNQGECCRCHQDISSSAHFSKADTTPK